MFSMRALSAAAGVPLIGAGRTSLLLRAPVRFMAKKAGAKKRLLPDPVAQIGGAVGGASSLQLAPSGASFALAAAGLRDAKRPKGGQLKAPTAEIPWTNQNVPNRGTRMGTISHRASWDTTASPSPGPRSGPMTYVGDEGHWANTRFSMDEWLVIEEAKKNQPGWDQQAQQQLQRRKLPRVLPQQHAAPTKIHCSRHRA